MRQIHTMAKKARRASSFQSRSGHGTQSGSRAIKREDRQAVEYSHKNLPVTRTQRIVFAKDQFGQKVYKTVLHADPSFHPKRKKIHDAR